MKPPSTPSDVAQQSRRTVRLPRDKALAFRAKCRERGHVGANLCYGWLMGSVALAQLGVKLPAKGSQPSSGTERGSILWSQSESEYAKCSDDIARANSTIRDTLGWWVDLYLALDGDQVQVWRAAFDTAQRAEGASDSPVGQSSGHGAPPAQRSTEGRDGEQLALAS